MCTGSHRFFGVAFHQTEFLEAVGHFAAHGKVHVGIFHTGASHFEHIVVTLFHNAINVELALAELATHGEGASMVGAIVVEVFGAAVAKSEASGFQKRL